MPLPRNPLKELWKELHVRAGGKKEGIRKTTRNED
jgi:hypothetical protein